MCCDGTRKNYANCLMGFWKRSFFGCKDRRPGRCAGPRRGRKGEELYPEAAAEPLSNRSRSRAIVWSGRLNYPGAYCALSGRTPGSRHSKCEIDTRSAAWAWRRVPRSARGKDRTHCGQLDAISIRARRNAAHHSDQRLGLPRARLRGGHRAAERSGRDAEAGTIRIAVGVDMTSSHLIAVARPLVMDEVHAASGLWPFRGSSRRADR